MSLNRCHLCTNVNQKLPRNADTVDNRRKGPGNDGVDVEVLVGQTLKCVCLKGNGGKGTDVRSVQVEKAGCRSATAPATYVVVAKVVHKVVCPATYEDEQQQSNCICNKMKSSKRGEARKRRNHVDHRTWL